MPLARRAQAIWVVLYCIKEYYSVHQGKARLAICHSAAFFSRRDRSWIERWLSSVEINAGVEEDT